MNNQYQGPGFGTEDTFTPDNLFAGDFPTETETITIAAGENLARGAVVGKITYSGEYALSTSAAVDGSETPIAVLVSDTDATAGSKQAGVYLTGTFNEAAVTIGTGHTADSIRMVLRSLSIFLKSTVAAG